MVFDPTYLFLAVLIFGMNVIPAFMPPTWVILAFFYIRLHLSLMPVVVIGATAATAGRIILSLIARNHFRQFLSKKTKENYDTIGKVFHAHRHISLPLLFMYAFFPLPSNQVYIIAGLANIDIRIIAASFFVGRLLSYTFWVTTAHHIGRRLVDIFSRYLNVSALALELAGFAVILLVGRIPWRRILRSHLRH